MKYRVKISWSSNNQGIWLCNDLRYAWYYIDHSEHEIRKCNDKGSNMLKLNLCVIENMINKMESSWIVFEW